MYEELPSRTRVESQAQLATQLLVRLVFRLGAVRKLLPTIQKHLRELL
jgi:hypothetical protein